MFKLFTIFSLSLGGFSAQAQTAKGEAINFYIENDSRNIGGPGLDNAYSNGFKLSFIAAENDIPNWAKPIVDRSEILRNALKGSQTNFGIAVAQQIYTPANTQSPDLILDDRPYAGWTYMALSSQFKNEKKSHSFEVDLGVVGPEAGGESVQNGFHNMIGVETTKGWKNQLQTEPTLQLAYQQRLRFFELAKHNQKNYCDVIPFFGGSVGNVAIDIHGGALVRFGTELPDDFGPTRPSLIDGDNFVNPVDSVYKFPNIYLFASARAVGIARNLFLDGNTFKQSHRVRKHPFLFETEIGFVAMYSHINLAWRFVTRSPEFEQKSNVISFASVSVGYTF